MSTLDLSVINAALTRTGNEPITSLTDGTAAAAVASANYEAMVLSELGYEWKWAKKTRTLNLLDEDVHGEPPDPWSYSYQLPSDVLLLRTIKVGGQSISYERMYDKVFCDYGSSDEVIAYYTWRPSEPYWPPQFKEAMTRRLEALFLRALAESYDEAEKRDDAAADAFALAKTLDSGTQPPVERFTSSILQARRA